MRPDIVRVYSDAGTIIGRPSPGDIGGGVGVCGSWGVPGGIIHVP